VLAEGEVVTTRGDIITITVTLLQNGSYGNTVPNQRIYFFDQTYDTLIGFDNTDTNGIASISWSIPLSHALGPTTINATFYGNESLSLAPSCQWTVLTIISSIQIELDHVPDLLAPEDTLSFSVHLTNDLHDPIPNATVTVFKDDIPLAVQTSNSSGDIYFEIECNISWITLGDNDIRIVHEQDLVNFLDTSESIFTVEISKIPTSLNLQNSYPNEITLNDILDLYFELSEVNNSLLNEPLQIFLDDSPLIQITSNGSGIAHLHLNIDERFTLGPHTLRIHYNGTKRYAESQIEIILFVKSPIQIVIEGPESVNIGSNVEVTITVFDLLGRHIPDSEISIFDTVSNQRFTILSNPTQTTTNFQYELQGPTGIHILDIEITENLFITNTTSSYTFSAWSSPTISLTNCNVEHYAFPGQEIYFEMKMSDWAGNCSAKSLFLFIDDEIQLSGITDTNGQAILSIHGPVTEKQYNISIFYSGNNTIFESPARIDYSLQVTSMIPVRLELDFYDIIAPLHELSVHLTLRGFNGSTPSAVRINFDWLDSSLDRETTEGGIIVLHLRIPRTIGDYVLYYESEASSSVRSTSGSFSIEITTADIMSLQGVGIAGLTLALIASVGISTVPIIRRRYLVG
jgi:hypothetical protein